MLPNIRVLGSISLFPCFRNIALIWLIHCPHDSSLCQVTTINRYILVVDNRSAAQVPLGNAGNRSALFIRRPRAAGPRNGSVRVVGPQLGNPVIDLLGTMQTCHCLACLGKMQPSINLSGAVARRTRSTRPNNHLIVFSLGCSSFGTAVKSMQQN